jgi:hypothetical protein
MTKEKWQKDKLWYTKKLKSNRNTAKTRGLRKGMRFLVPLLTIVMLLLLQIMWKSSAREELRQKNIYVVICDTEWVRSKKNGFTRTLFKYKVPNLSDKIYDSDTKNNIKL